MHRPESAANQQKENYKTKSFYLAPFETAELRLKYTCFELGPVSAELRIDLRSPYRMEIQACADHAINILGFGLRSAYGQKTVNSKIFEKELRELQRWVHGEAENYPVMSEPRTSKDSSGTCFR